MTKPLLIAQITDLHIKRPGELAYGKIDTASALKRMVETLEALRPRPDIVVVSGDLVDAGTPEEYAHLLELLAPLTLPLLVCPGNHDHRENLRAAFPDQRFSTSAACNTRHDVGPLTLLVTDSSTPRKSFGTLDEETIGWLQRELKDAAGRPTLIFMHHPPFATGIWHMDRQNLIGADALAELVRAHGNVRLVAAGHVHRATVTSFAGTVATIAPAPSHAVALDLEQALPPSFNSEPPAFHLHAWMADSASLVTHQVPVGQFSGPHPFFDAGGKLL
ncbi:MAG: phosphodiesterase [Bosea sp. (in: a-proteobacteria)]